MSGSRAKKGGANAGSFGVGLLEYVLPAGREDPEVLRDMADRPPITYDQQLDVLAELSVETPRRVGDLYSKGESPRDRRSGVSMGDDWYVMAVDEVASAADQLHGTLERVVGLLAIAREERLAGRDLTDIVGALIDGGGRDARLAPTVAFGKFEHAVTMYRARTVRALVEEKGMTFTAVGNLIGVSRQMIARLYRAGVSDRGTGSGRSV